MNPLLGIAVSIIPDLVRVLAGDKGGSAAEKVTEAIKEVAATDDQAAVKQKLDTDPAARAELQKRLADIALEETKAQLQAEADLRRIDLDFYREHLAQVDRERKDEFDRLKTEVEDRNRVRENYMALAREDSPFAWVVPILSVITALALFYFLHRIMVTREPIENRDVFNTLLGALVTAFVTVISFYFGSSSGSRNKDKMIANGQLVSTTGSPQIPELSNQGSQQAESQPPQPTGGVIRERREHVYTGPFALFQQKAPNVMRQLMRDFNLSKEQAAGILGNLGHECAGFRLLQEQKPQQGGRGGWGWCQWTGPRRREFESWATNEGLDFASDAANYGFLKRELTGSEAGVLAPLRQTQNVEQATSVFMKRFERPGIEHLDRRIEWSRLALTAYKEAGYV
jgi:hypothetical protein